MENKRDLRGVFPALYREDLTITYVRPDGVHVTLELPVAEAYLLQRELNKRLAGEP